MLIARLLLYEVGKLAGILFLSLIRYIPSHATMS